MLLTKPVIQSKNTKPAGFTLLELIITLTLITGILVTGGSYVKRKDNKIRKTFRQFIALNRQLDQMSRLKRETYRLVINIGENTTYSTNENTKDKKNTWWVEKKLQKNQMPENTSDTSDTNDTNDTSDTKNITPDGFIEDTSFFEKPQTLPKQLTFESLESLKDESPITQGKAYIYYFPEGQFNTALLKIKGNRVYWSLFIDRLNGELTVFDGNKNLKDFEQQ